MSSSLFLIQQEQFGKMKTAPGLVFLLLVIGFAACVEPNFPPTVAKIEASSTIIEINQEITLTCYGHDFDGDSLEYLWSSPVGVFRHGSDNQTVNWVAPDQVGSFEISVQVSDGKKSSLGSLNINVVLEISTGSFVDDRDGNNYSYATIGTQVWMTENLAWLPVVSAPDSGRVDSALYYVYDFFEDGATSLARQSSNYLDFGVLYNYPAAVAACPTGWHLPDDAEWNLLGDFLGEDPGFQMKDRLGWKDSGNGENSSQFTAKPGGYRYFAGRFGGLTSYAYFWSATTTRSGDPNRFYLSYKSDQLLQGPTGYPEYGLSIRCIRNN